MTYLDRMFGLTGRTSLITGGSSGIGLGIARALGSAGARVLIAARSESGLVAAAESLRADGIEVDVRVADLATAEGIRVACQDEVDVLVNCAGINLRPPMDELAEADYLATVALNQTAPFLLGQHHGPRMAERGWGRIINIGSQQQDRAFGNSGAYGISKAAVAALTRSQAEAWSRRGVTANTLVPGFVVTPMTQQTIAIEGREAELAARSMLGRNGLPDDFASATLFLAAPASGYVTGSTVYVDGGFSVH